MRVVRVALAAAFCGLASGAALADDARPPAHGGVTAFIVGLRQTVSESGARVIGEAARWLSKLELGIGPVEELRPGIRALALETTGRAMIPVMGAALGARDAASEHGSGGVLSAVHRQVRLGLDKLAGTRISSDEPSWSMAGARSNLGAEIGGTALDPETYLTGNINRGPVVGTALAEQSLNGHDIELGLPMPALPDMHITAARYWWGDRTFFQETDGYRVGLNYDISKHLRFEGGRSEDQVHGVAGFFGFRYSIPLDTERPPGVMPLNN